jgi:hypothetical protein
MANQYPEIRDRLLPQIERVRAHLARGERASAVATSLQAEGLGNIELLIIFGEATGASLGDLKAFGQWWGDHGVTDADAFDRWAEEVFPRASPRE